MAKYRVFLESVVDPEDPKLVQCLMKLSKRDARAVAVLLDGLPKVLADDLDQESAERLKAYLQPHGATVMLKASAGHPHPTAAKQGIRKSPPATEADQIDRITPIEPPEQQQTSARANTAEPPEQGASSTLATAPRPLNFFNRMEWAFEVFSGTWGRQLLLFFIMLGVVMLGQTLVNLVIGSASVNLADSADPLAAMQSVTPLAIVGFLLFELLILLAGFWYQACVTRLIAAFMEDGDGGSLMDIMSNAFARLPDLSNTIGLILLPFMLVFLLLAFLASSAFLPHSPGGFGFAMLLVSLTLVMLMIGFSLAAPIAVLESAGPVTAIRRAWGLSKSRRLRIFGNLVLILIGLMLGIFLLQFLIGLMLPAGLWGVFEFDAQTLGITVMMALVIFLFIMLLIYVLALFLTYFVLTAFYFEARVCDEDWAPAWDVVPDASWPASDEDPRPAKGRGGRAWLELLLLLVLGLIVFVAALVITGAGFKSLMAHSMGAPQVSSRSITRPTVIPVQTAPTVFADLPDGYEVQLETSELFGGGAGPQKWIKVALRHDGNLPQGVNTQGLVTIRIDSISDAQGKEMYDAGSSTETEFHSKPVLSRQSDTEVGGIRMVSLLPGSTDDQIQSVRGELILELPDSISRERLSEEDVDTVRELADDLSIRLEYLDGRQAKLEIQGENAKQRLSGILGITAEGERVGSVSRSYSSFGDTLSEDLNYAEDIEGIEILFGAGRQRFQYSFDMGARETLVLGQ